MVIVLSARHLPESRSPDARGTTDYLGAAAVVVFLSGVTFAFIEAPASYRATRRSDRASPAADRRPPWWSARVSPC
jgi:peptidoglycan/LPS O-acetylase OafA/YrhL